MNFRNSGSVSIDTGGCTIAENYCDMGITLANVNRMNINNNRFNPRVYVIRGGKHHYKKNRFFGQYAFAIESPSPVLKDSIIKENEFYVSDRMFSTKARPTNTIMRNNRF
jgi:hypothetical protein